MTDKSVHKLLSFCKPMGTGIYQFPDIKTKLFLDLPDSSLLCCLSGVMNPATKV